MRTSQPPADWVERVRRGAPGLLEPVGDDQLPPARGAPDSPPGKVDKLPEPPRTPPAGAAEPAAPPAAAEPAPPRPSQLEVPAPPRRPDKRPATAGDSGGRRTPRRDGGGTGARGPGRDRRPLRPRARTPHSRVVRRPPGGCARPLAAGDAGACSGLHRAGGQPTPRRRCHRRRPARPVPSAAIPIRLSAPISAEAAPRSIHRPDIAADRARASRQRATTAPPGGGQAGFSFASLAGPSRSAAGGRARRGGCIAQLGAGPAGRA